VKFVVFSVFSLPVSSHNSQSTGDYSGIQTSLRRS